MSPTRRRALGILVALAAAFASSVAVAGSRFVAGTVASPFEHVLELEQEYE